MCYFAILGPCDPQHDIYTPLGNLYTEAVLITVKEMSLGTSLVPQPATCWEWFLEHFSLAWALPRGVLAGTGWKLSKDHFADFTGWMVVFHLKWAQPWVSANGLSCNKVWKTWEPSCHHFCTLTNRKFDHVGHIRLLEWWWMYSSVSEVNCFQISHWQKTRVGISCS